MIGSVIITRYNNKTYRIDEVDFNTNPNSTFQVKKRGETTHIKYVDYFKDVSHIFHCVTDGSDGNR